MAEQSIGMATGTGASFGDGNVGSGYASSRLTAMETKTLSDGVLQVGSEMAMSGTGSATLAIADGAAVVGGYFYENTTSSSINISTLANATYNVVMQCWHLRIAHLHSEFHCVCAMTHATQPSIEFVVHQFAFLYRRASRVVACQYPPMGLRILPSSLRMTA